MSETVEIDDNNDVEVSRVSPITKQRKLTSLVWGDFTKEKKANGITVAHCNHCKKDFTGNSKSGTTHLKNHLSACAYYQRAKKRKPDIGQLLLKPGERKNDGSTSLECFQFNQESSREDLARMIILHEYPFSMVHHIGFRTFLRNVQPLFNLMSRTTVKTDCMKVYEKEKDKLYNVLDKLPCRVSLTTDMWSSSGNLGYLCLTCHYVDDDWKLKKKILNFMHVEGRHTSENILKVILERLYDWNIDGKLFSIVMDNCSTNDAVARDLRSALCTKKSLLYNGDLFHVRCCAHILNLIVQDGLDLIREVIHNERESVKYVKSSQARQERFSKVANQVRAPQKSLIQDVPTRWNSTYLMLQRACEFEEAFSRLAACDKKYTHLPSSRDWENVKLIMECLETFYQVTERFSGTKFPTANLYFKDICGIYITLKELQFSPHHFLASMALPMLDKFEKYWSIVNMVLAIASVLDPRYKMKSVEYFFGLIYEGTDLAEKNIKKIRSSLTTLYNEYAARSSIISSNQELGSSIDSNSSASTRAECTSSKVFPRSKLARTFIGLDQFLEESSSSQPVKSDLDMYLEEAVHPSKIHLEEKFDILTWWKSNEMKYPILSLAARDILGVPVSTVASESAFSTGGRVLDQYRSSMNPTTVQGLICAQDWLRNEIEASSSVGIVDGLSTIFASSNLNGDSVISTLPTTEVESCTLSQ